jgi:hypothetical protein
MEAAYASKTFAHNQSTTQCNSPEDCLYVSEMLKSLKGSNFSAEIGIARRIILKWLWGSRVGGWG